MAKEIKTGWLEKRNRHGFWQRRYFLLDERALNYYHGSDVKPFQLRDFQDAKCDCILKYSAEEARNLKAYGELPDTAKINEGAVGADPGADEADDCAFNFEDI